MEACLQTQASRWLPGRRHRRGPEFALSLCTSLYSPLVVLFRISTYLGFYKQKSYTFDYALVLKFFFSPLKDSFSGSTNSFVSKPLNIRRVSIEVENWEHKDIYELMSHQQQHVCLGAQLLFHEHGQREAFSSTTAIAIAITVIFFRFSSRYVVLISEPLHIPPHFFLSTMHVCTFFSATNAVI